MLTLYYIFSWIAAMVLDTSMITYIEAALLGFGNVNPSPCYDKFPNCPRNPDKLVHYLNNHNGGFFRFFSQSVHGSYPQSSYASRGRSVADDAHEFKNLYELNCLLISRQVIRKFSEKVNRKIRRRASPVRRLIVLERPSWSLMFPFRLLAKSTEEASFRKKIHRRARGKWCSRITTNPMITHRKTGSLNPCRTYRTPT